MSNRGSIITVAVILVVFAIGVFALSRKRYTFDGNTAVLKENATRREISIASGKETVVPRYEFIKGCLESGTLQMLIAINNTNAADWVSCSSEKVLTIAFALDCVRSEDKDPARVCNIYLLVGSECNKLRIGTDEANRVLGVLNRNDGDVGKCSAWELLQGWK